MHFDSQQPDFSRIFSKTMHKLFFYNSLADRQMMERKNTELWVENQMLKLERRLLPSAKEADARKQEDER